MQQLQTTKTASLWSYFLKICAIPHPSEHEQQLVSWIINWARERKILCTQDEVGNLILRKPACRGLESKAPVILQAHMDMVPQKNSDTQHDFLTDAITPIISGEWMHADNTTLGADNGIGMASCLAVLADKTIEHGPLEVLLTTNEEIGMVGAFALQADSLAGKILINTDSEQEGDLYIGCAGGVKLYVDLPYKKKKVDPSEVAYEIALSGLKGGHSGCDIHLQRANAIKELADILHQLHIIPFHLAFFEGGSLRNAIPREARAVITCDPLYQESLELLIHSLQLNLQNEYKAVEDNLQLSVKASVLPETVLTHQCQNNLLNSLKDCDDGVFTMDDNFSDVVQTSSNLGVITQNSDEKTSFSMQILVRSQIEVEKQECAEQIISHFQDYGATCRKEGNYPGWKPDLDSTIYKVVKTQYSKLFNTQPETMVIHAGLECGLFSNKYPHWDMVSFGPTIKFPHSPDEKVHIPSVDKYWQLLIATLKAID